MRAVGDEGGEEDMDQEREGESDGDGGTASCSGRSSSEKLLRRNLKGRFAACVGRCGGTPDARGAYIASENEERERAGRAGGGRRWWRRRKRGRAGGGERGMWKGRVRLREGHFCSECRSFPSPACLCPVRPCPRFRTQHHLISPLISLHLPPQSHIHSSTKKIKKQWRT